MRNIEILQIKSYHNVIDTKKGPSLAFFDFRWRRHFDRKNFEHAFIFGASYGHHNFFH